MSKSLDLSKICYSIRQGLLRREPKKLTGKAKKIYNKAVGDNG